MTLAAIDENKCFLLVLQDLLTTFNIIDQKKKFSSDFPIDLASGDNLLDWFRSYLSNRSCNILIEDIELELNELPFGVPPGSVLGPVLFIQHTSILGDLLQQYGVSCHFYADNTQLYISFDLSPRLSGSKAEYGVVC